MELSRVGRKNAGRGGGEYTLLRSIPGKDSLRLFSASVIELRFQAAVLGGSSDVVLVGDSISVRSAFFLRAFHASIAFARQLVLTFAKEAAASESFNFSAYPHILGPADVGEGEGLASGLIPIDGNVDGEEDADGGECDKEGVGDRGVRGDGGTSIELWFVIPRQTLVASRDVKPGGPTSCCVSVSLPSSCESSFSLSSFPSSSLGEGDNWLVKPFHIVTFRRAPRPRFSTFGAFISSSRRWAMSEAVWSITSIPPAASTGYNWRRDIPSRKASLSSHGRRGEGGGREACSSPQRPGDLRPGFPSLVWLSLLGQTPTK
jgi:hypothetical protein